MTRTTLPPLPLEIWSNIFDLACNNDDGTTALSLSCTSRTLRNMSRFHRYRTVQVAGWPQLAALERTLTGILMKEERHILHLSIDVPELYSAAYPDAPWWHPDEESDDDSDTDTDSDSDLSDTSYDDENDGDESEESDSDSDATDGSAYYEFDDLSDDEADDLADEVLSLQNTTGCTPLDKELIAQKRLSFHSLSSSLRGARSPLASLEYTSFITLKHVLTLAAPTLQTLALAWDPYHSFRLHAVLPVFPRLEWLGLDMLSGGPHMREALSRSGTVSKVWIPAPMHMDGVEQIPQLFPRVDEVYLRGWPGAREAARTLPYFLLPGTPRKYLVVSIDTYTNLVDGMPELAALFHRIDIVCGTDERELNAAPFGKMFSEDDVLVHLLPEDVDEVPADWPILYRAAFFPRAFKTAMQLAWLRRISR